MSLLGEYINKKMGPMELENELLQLINLYNSKTNSFLFVYAASFTKNIPDIPINMDDYFIISDILKSTNSEKLDFYVESPGGSGETVEEIVECIRSKFKDVNFVVSGEAKSAGTILVLSGNEISITDSGSLGPIDAQIKIGRGVVSAYDYMEWVDEKRKEASKNLKLNPFDATIIAQISPGELNGVDQALNFATDLIKDWLPKYKFRDWNKTETKGKTVTGKMKKTRASYIANELVNHSKWRSHGRSLKIDDLKNLLKINRIDDDPKLAEIVYRIQTVIKLLFQLTSIYKIFATATEKIFRSAVSQNQASSLMPKPKKIDAIELEVKCPQCGQSHELYGKVKNDPKIDMDFKNKGKKPIVGQDKIICSCGFAIDIIGIRNDLENKTGAKFV